jgi:cell division septum initiation protein DivIVA
MPTLEMPHDEAQSLLTRAEKKADTLLGLAERDRAHLRSLAAHLRQQGVQP